MTQAGLAEGDLEQMAASGVGTLRAFVAWSAIDPGPAVDDLDLSGLDQVIGEAARNRIEVLPYLLTTPDWVAEGESGRCGEGCAVDAPSSPAALQAWRELVAAVVDRYGPDGEFWNENPDLPELPVRRWQIWNEQNSPTFYGPRPDAAEYAQLLIAASEEIRSRDPGAEVLLGGMAASPLQGQRPAYTAAAFLRRLYATPGAREAFDAVAAHPYAAEPEAVAEQIEALRAEIERADDDARLWATEIGWSSAEGEHPFERGLEGQAENLTAAYELLLSRREEWGLEGTVWFSWRDHTATEICEWCPYSGLYPEGESDPKPAGESYAALPRSD